MISECSRDSDPLLFTPAQLVRKMISPVLKPHAAQQFHRPIPGYSSFDSRRYEWKLNVLQCGQNWNEIMELEYEAYLMPSQLRQLPIIHSGDILTIYECSTRAWLIQCSNNVEKRRLAGP